MDSYKNLKEFSKKDKGIPNTDELKCGKVSFRLGGQARYTCRKCGCAGHEAEYCDATLPQRYYLLTNWESLRHGQPPEHEYVGHLLTKSQVQMVEWHPNMMAQVLQQPREESSSRQIAASVIPTLQESTRPRKTAVSATFQKDTPTTTKIFKELDKLQAAHVQNIPLPPGEPPEQTGNNGNSGDLSNTGK